MITDKELVCARRALWWAFAKLVFWLALLIIIMAAAIGLFVAVV